MSSLLFIFFFFFNDTATTEIYTLSLHDALPTYGRVSRFGLLAFASSLDQIGTFARTVDDAALGLEVISGHDPSDATSAPREVPSFTDALTGRIDGLRIGVPWRLLEAGVDRQ